MAHHNFLIRYSNGLKRHVSKSDLDLLSKSLTQIGPHEYLCSASWQQETELRANRKREETGPSYLDMRQYVFECHGEREFEREPTPIGIVRQLERMGFSPEAAA